MDERIWLKHKETGGYFHCPVGAIEAFEAKGWGLTDERPAELNAAISERITIDPAQLKAYKDGLVRAEALAKRLEEQEVTATAKEGAKPRKRAAKPQQAGETSDTASPDDAADEVADGS